MPAQKHSRLYRELWLRFPRLRLCSASTLRITFPADEDVFTYGFYSAAIHRRHYDDTCALLHEQQTHHPETGAGLRCERALSSDISGLSHPASRSEIAPKATLWRLYVWLVCSPSARRKHEDQEAGYIAARVHSGMQQSPSITRPC